MKFLFLIGSALKHFQEGQFSAFTEQERFNQTLETIKSVREKVPNSYIVLFECSHDSIDEEKKNILKEKTDLFLEFYDNPVIKQIYENIKETPNFMIYGKSLLETTGLLNTLYTIQKNNLLGDSQRIFKLTGRYLLNNSFNIEDYQSKFFEGKYIIKRYQYASKDEDSQNFYSYLYGSKGMIVTGLWSFDRSLFSDAVKALESSFSYMEKMIQFTSGIDIEHSLDWFIDKDNAIIVPDLGLTVVKGMTGENGGVYNL